jgi:hypothetical protein
MIHWRATCEPSQGAAISKTPMPIQSTVNPPQQIPRPLRLDVRVGEHSQFSDGAVGNGDNNGQRAGGLQRQVSHLRLHAAVYGETTLTPIATVNTVLYGAA